MSQQKKDIITGYIARGMTQVQAENAYDRRMARESCEHNWHRAGHVGMCIVYECNKCGDSYEKDVS